jgi:hypothetical protein
MSFLGIFSNLDFLGQCQLSLTGLISLRYAIHENNGKLA